MALENQEMPPKKRGKYLAWQPDSTSAGYPIELGWSVLTWTGKKWITNFSVTHWQELPPDPTAVDVAKEE